MLRVGQRLTDAAVCNIIESYGYDPLGFVKSNEGVETTDRSFQNETQLAANNWLAKRAIPFRLHYSGLQLAEWKVVKVGYN